MPSSYETPGAGLLRRGIGTLSSMPANVIHLLAGAMKDKNIVTAVSDVMLRMWFLKVVIDL